MTDNKKDARIIKIAELAQNLAKLMKAGVLRHDEFSWAIGKKRWVKGNQVFFTLDTPGKSGGRIKDFDIIEIKFYHDEIVETPGVITLIRKSMSELKKFGVIRFEADLRKHGILKF